MPQIDLSFAKDPNTLALALIYGMVPAVLWLFYWLRENKERPRHFGLLTACFAAGIFAVALALPVERYLGTLSSNDSILTILWASAEELLKFGAFALIILTNKRAIEEPIDYAIYIMVVALGFAGFENALYFLHPLQAGDTVTLFLSGTMRFLGTTLMHAVTASFAGIVLGFAYYRSKISKVALVIIALLLACTLHSLFNLSAAQSTGGDFFQLFGILWVGTICVLILFERLRTMSMPEFRKGKIDAVFSGLDAEFAELLASAGAAAADEMPITVAFKNKGVPSDAPELQKMHAFLQNLRRFYAEYLGNEGANAETVQQTAFSVIPETISPRAVSGIIMALKSGVGNRVSKVD